MQKQILCDKYEILEEIGHGGMGTVYKARDLHLDRYVAMKQVPLSEEDERLDELKNEMELLKKLNHKSLLQILDFFSEEGTTYLVMEYVQGKSLDKYLKSMGNVEQEQAVRWMLEIAEVLEYLHSRRPPVLYLDLKPANIMIDEEQHAKLIDFGTAYHICSDSKRKKVRGGTIGYAAPEQLSTEIEARMDERCDIYAFGATLHELLTGSNPAKPPYERRKLREYNGALSGNLEKMIEKCTSHLPEKRYADMEEVKETLLHYKKHSGIGRLLEIAATTFYYVFLCSGMVFLYLGIYCQKQMWFWLPLLFAFFIKAGMLVVPGKRYIRKQEKNIWLSEKNSIGLHSFQMLFLTGTAMLVAGVMGREPLLVKAGEANSLSYILYDESQRKLLVKENAVYQPENNLSIEIPVEQFQTKEKLSLQLLVLDEKGKCYQSQELLFQIP